MKRGDVEARPTELPGTTGASANAAVTTEVRFAVVLYGGVSLAIYMNGIAQELFALARATGLAQWNRPHVPDCELHGAEKTYRELACLLDGEQVRSRDNADGTIRTRFVIDILTGTSAGGINGVFLAKALANDQRIDGLTDLWIERGDIAKLLNDADAYRETGDLSKEKPPESLLSGSYMLYELLSAFDEVGSASEMPVSPYADQIDLWVTTTDLRGRPEVVDLSDQPRLGESREVDHHTRLHFVYDASGFDEPVNMFRRSYDPLLAFAARATSSFPGAFRPVQPRDLAPVVDAYLGSRPPDDRTRPWCSIGSEEAARLFQHYGGVSFYENASFADGGYLDNQPVDLVMETLPRRSSDLPVRRRVLLVDPNPGGDSGSRDPAGVRVDLVTTLVDVLALPSVETIGREIDRIEALVGPLETRAAVYEAVKDSLQVPTEGATRPLAPGYAVLRVRDTLDDLAEAITRVGFSSQAFDADTPEYRLAREVVGTWHANSPGDDLLARLDLAYALRRISMVKHELIQRGGSQMHAVMLDAIRQDLVRQARQLRDRIRATPGLDALRTNLDGLRYIATLPEPGEAERATRDAERQALQAAAQVALDTVFSAFAEVLAITVSTSTAQRLVDLVGDDRVAACWYDFASFDEATLALRKLVPGENGDIRVVRVSPRDARAVFQESDTSPKLAGTAVHHFGAFFSPDWRRSDIMWGRLDAAERLISVLLDGDVDDGERRRRDELARTLTHEAHEGILNHLMTRDGAYVELFKTIAPGCDAASPGVAGYRPPAADVLAALEHFRSAPGPERKDMLQLATRAARVTDGVAAGLGDVPGPLAGARKLLSAILRPFAQLGELVLDRSLKSILTRRIIDLAILAALLMVIVGPFIGTGGVVSFGWSLLAVSVALRILVNVAGHWLAREPGWWVALAVVAALAVAMGIEGLLLCTGATRWAGLLALGVALGLVVASPPVLGGGASTRRLVAVALAVALVAGCAVVGIRQVATHPVGKLCRQSSWEHDLIDRIPGVDCPRPTPGLRQVPFSRR